METALSVVICAHNPRKDYLERVLTALKSQTLSSNRWELLLVDNASKKILSLDFDLTWHSQSRHIREEQLGLTPARLRGIQESQGETLIFVDDDNVLEPDFLEVALQISQNYPFLGAWGGQIRPKFEKQPPAWIKPYLTCLAIREVERDKWSNLLHQHETIPCGAGLCVRKVVAEKYSELVRQDPRRMSMGRKGKLLTACEDSDIAFTACDIGFGTGLFTSLKLTHLIPPNRLEEAYLLRLVEGLSYSQTLLESFRGKLPLQPSWKSSKIYLQYLRWRYGSRTRRFYEASQRGIKLALEEITHLHNYSSH